jgi:gamma-glutamyl hydrolase
MINLLFVLAALIPAAAAAAAAEHELAQHAMQPVIGILTNPIGTNSTPKGGGWMGMSMTKWFESAGAQVVPIPYNAPVSVLNDLFMGLNGIAFQGGDMLDAFDPVASYYQTAKYLFERVLTANAAGDTFPLWGSCLGMQLIALLAAEGDEQIVQCGYDSENLALALNYSSLDRDGSWPDGSLYSSVPPEVALSLNSSAFTLNYHHCGVPPAVARGSLGFHQHFDIMSTNFDRSGREFVSSIQARGLDPIGPFWAPIFATQFHPELQMDGAPW